MKLKFLLSTLIFVGGCSFERRSALNETVVAVNGHELTTKDFSERLARALSPFDALMAKDPKNIKRTKERVIQDFIHEAVIETWAEKSKIDVSKNELDNSIESARKDYPDDISFRKALASAGVSLSEWKSDLRRSLMEKKLFDFLRKKMASLTDEELKSFYDENHLDFKENPRVRLKQILVEKEEDANRIHKALTSNTVSENFPARHSETTWVDQGTLEVFDQAFKMKKGQWSPVLKSVYGYHIYRVEEFKPGRQWTFEEAKDKIRQLMMADREQAAYSAWLEEQIRHANVSRNDAVISAISVETIGEP
ncbi:MAG: peptidyl-prolyl cis-trans isomerase [Bdellovibrionales bacterium]|nr:peptidyl-prolyl cis-trans isomerase [Bdellovibrionales bacterium]